jgi:hypothetical protein
MSCTVAAVIAIAKKCLKNDKSFKNAFNTQNKIKIIIFSVLCFE